MGKLKYGYVCSEAILLSNSKSILAVSQNMKEFGKKIYNAKALFEKDHVELTEGKDFCFVEACCVRTESAQHCHEERFDDIAVAVEYAWLKLRSTDHAAKVFFACNVTVEELS